MDSQNQPIGNPTDWDGEAIKRRARRRHLQEKVFKTTGIIAIALAASFLVLLLANVVRDGSSGFFQSHIEVDIYFDPALLGDPTADPDAFQADLPERDTRRLLLASLLKVFPDVQSRRDQRALLLMFSNNSRSVLRTLVAEAPELVGTNKRVRLLASDEIDQVVKGHVDLSTAESNRRVKDREAGWLKTLQDDGRVSLRFHTPFLTSGDSRDPELAGIWGAVVGSALTLLVTFGVALPTGVMTAVYLEEFAPKNRLTDLIEININNLAAVPSIVFGLLGLAVFLDTMSLPRSAPLVGGLTLALMTLPTIIISSRAAIRAVPLSIREAAGALGASPMQVIFHHTIPSAMPGIMTGSIIGMAQALGETAPLLMIGMVAFVVDIPGTVTDAATVLPVQVYLWADSPERAFQEKTAAAIMVLLFFLLTMNGIAVLIRQYFERQR